MKKSSHSFDKIMSLIRHLESNDFHFDYKVIHSEMGVDKDYVNQLLRSRYFVDIEGFVELIKTKNARPQLKAGRQYFKQKSQASIWQNMSIPLDFLKVNEEQKLADEVEFLSVQRINTPFGFAYAAECEYGICELHFGVSKKKMSGYLKEKYTHAKNGESQVEIEKINTFFNNDLSIDEKINIAMLGSDFQKKVWSKLLHIPRGYLLSYGDIAKDIDTVASSRAVANAIGRNSIAYLIPCHRVVRANGLTTGYRWGSERKKAMLAYEFVRMY